MALVFGDSFDHYPTADLGKKWTVQAGIVRIGLGYALSPHATCVALLSTTSGTLEKVLAANLTTFVAGFWFRCGTTNGAHPIFAGMDSATPANIHVSLRHDATGHLTLCRDATVLATSTNTISNDTWYHVEIKATIDDANGEYEVRVDGSAVNWVPAATGKDTRNSGNANIGSVKLYGGVNSAEPLPHFFQDFYLLNTTGAQASDFLGPSRFAVLRPVTAGTTAEWTGNYADNWVNVSDSIADSDSTFNQSSTAGRTDQFAMTDVPAGTIHAIQHVIFAKRDAGGARTIRPITRIAGTDYNGATVTVAATYLFYCEPVMFSPATGGATAWDDAELNGAEMGYELVS